MVLNPTYRPRRRRLLSSVDEGETVRVVGIGGGRGVCRRLGDMGLSNNSVISIIQNSGGPVVIRCGDTRMALGRGISNKITVE